MTRPTGYPGTPTARLLRTAQGGRRGFTLMELLAALSIIAVMASVSLPAMDTFFSSQRAAAEANQFIQNVRMAQYRATETQIYHRLYFYPDGTGYKLSAYDRPAGWNHPTTVKPADVVVAANPASLNWVDLTGQEIIEFDPLVKFASPSVTAIFFSPDGMLLTSPENMADPIPDCVATFSYGNTQLAVNLTQIGIRSSEEFYEE